MVILYLHMDFIFKNMKNRRYLLILNSIKNSFYTKVITYNIIIHLYILPSVRKILQQINCHISQLHFEHGAFFKIALIIIIIYYIDNTIHGYIE